MKNIRNMLVCVAIGSSVALGCAFEMSPESSAESSFESDLTPEGPIAANQGDQLAPDTAIYWYKRGRALIMQAEAGNFASYGRATEALQKCIDKDPKITECFQLMALANRPRPACPACSGASGPSRVSDSITTESPCPVLVGCGLSESSSKLPR